MSYKCDLKEQPAQPVLSIRRRAKVEELPQIMGQVFGAVGQYLGELGQAPAGEPFAAYYNMDMQNLDVEIGFPVSKPLPGKGEIQLGALPGGRWVTCLYKGPYSDMPPAYEAVTRWIQEHGYEPTGVWYEMYLNDPQQVAPQEVKTLIGAPLK